MSQFRDKSRTPAEENFKATFGHYPQRVDLPEPDPAEAGFVASLFARRYRQQTGKRQPLRGIDGGKRDA